MSVNWRNLRLNFSIKLDRCFATHHALNRRMKPSRFLIIPAVFASVVLFAGCKTAPRKVTIIGQISVTAGEKIQKTGLAPIWIYDETNSLLTTNLPLPNFGGRSRKDWQRITTAYPNSLNVYSNYAVVQPLGGQAQTKRITATEIYYKMKAALNGQTNSAEFEAVLKQEVEVKRILAEENKLWDAADDLRDLIVLWYNLNPGILYATGVPEPLATAQTDKSGKFSFSLPAGKKVLIAAHIEGTVDDQPGNYFWLVPFAAGNATTNVIVLTADNATCKRTKSQMPQIILPKDNGYIGAVGFWMLNRVRDARLSYEPPPSTTNRMSTPRAK